MVNSDVLSYQRCCEGRIFLSIGDLIRPQDSGGGSPRTLRLGFWVRHMCSSFNFFIVSPSQPQRAREVVPFSRKLQPKNEGFAVVFPSHA